MATPLESVVLVQGIVKERMKKANVEESASKVCKVPKLLKRH